MPRAEKIPEREREIGTRLRKFREGKLISRTAFALSLGIGYPRLESYEAGRVPLPFDIFRLINEKYSLSATWLCLNEGAETWPFVFDYEPLEGIIPPKALFSKAYDRVLRREALRQSTTALEAEYGPQGYQEIVDRFVTAMCARQKIKPLSLTAKRKLLQNLRKFLDDFEQPLSEVSVIEHKPT